MEDFRISVKFKKWTRWGWCEKIFISRRIRKIIIFFHTRKGKHCLSTIKHANRTAVSPVLPPLWLPPFSPPDILAARRNRAPSLSQVALFSISTDFPPSGEIPHETFSRKVNYKGKHKLLDTSNLRVRAECWQKMKSPGLLFLLWMLWFWLVHIPKATKWEV